MRQANRQSSRIRTLYTRLQKINGVRYKFCAAFTTLAAVAAFASTWVDGIRPAAGGCYAMAHK